MWGLRNQVVDELLIRLRYAENDDEIKRTATELEAEIAAIPGLKSGTRKALDRYLVSFFKAIATDEGSRWAVEQLTADPHNDNIRPICARTDTIGVLAWLRGRMATYSDYRFEAVVLVDG